MNTRYTLSGKPGNIFILGILLGPVLTILLSIVYTYIVVYNPFIYLTLLVFIGFLLGIAVIQHTVVLLAKCRSRVSSFIYGTIVGLFAIYSVWASFIFVMFRRDGIPIDLIDLLKNPLFIFATAKSIAVEGYFSIFSTPIKGIALWAIWTIESLGILTAGIVAGIAALDEQVFCEDCKKWAEDTNFGLTLGVQDVDAAKNICETNINALLDLPHTQNLNSNHVKLKIHQCPTCKQLTTLTVEAVGCWLNEKGEQKSEIKYSSPLYILHAHNHAAFLNKKAEASGS